MDIKESKEQKSKKKLSTGMREAVSWLAQNPQEAALLLPSGVKKYLKTMGFLTLWLAAPLIIIMAMFTGPASFIPSAKPEIYVQEKQLPADNAKIEFIVKFQGVKDIIPEGAKVNIVIQDLNAGAYIRFENILTKQKPGSPEIFQGNINLSKEFLNKTVNFWLKGPVHLQRKFENLTIVEGQVLDLTDKPLLPGDVQLPQTGSDNEISDLDRDYLWSLLQAAGQRRLTAEEIISSDLDFDGKITSRDMSLLIDSGLGTKGEE